MDTLLTQMRTRYSSARRERTGKAVSFKDQEEEDGGQGGKTDEGGSIADRTIPPQKTQSFKGKFSLIGEGEKTDEVGSSTDRRISPQKTQSFRGKLPLMGEGEKTDEASSSTDRRIPPQKTQSFKERKRPQIWWGRQTSRQKSQDYSGNGVEYAVAVAAAAFAINTLDEAGAPDQKKVSEQPRRSLTSTNSRKDDEAGVPDQKKTSEQPKRPLTPTRSRKQDESIPAREGGGISRQLSGKSEVEVPEIEDKKAKTSQKAERPRFSFRRTPSFGEQLKSTTRIKPEIAAAEPEVPGKVKPSEYERQTSTRPGIPPADSQQQSPWRSAWVETETDDREKTELAKIRDGYENLNSRILSWEEKRKKKARRRLDNTQGELERRRKKAMERFHAEMEYNEQVVKEARRKAEEWRRTEEIKAKEKGNIRAPKSRFCC